MFERARRCIERADRGEGRKDLCEVVQYMRSCAPLGPVPALRARLNLALRTASTTKELRLAVIAISSELEDAEQAEAAPPTERAPVGYPAPWEGDAAPPTPRGGSEDDGGV